MDVHMEVDAVAAAVFRSLKDSETECWCALDLNGTVLGCSRALERLLGWTADEVVGKRVGFVPAHERPTFLAMLANVGSGDAVRVRLDVAGRFGVCREMAVRAMPLVDERGATIGASALFTDTSARRRAAYLGDRFLAIAEAALRLDPLDTVLDALRSVVASIAPDLSASVEVGPRNPARSSEPGRRHAFEVPIDGAGGTQAGTIRIAYDDGRVLAPWEIETVRQAAGCAALVLGRYRDRETLRMLAMHDPLTRLPNRLLADDRLAAAAEVARRDDARVGLLIVDVDRFKSINDRYGHHAGDLVLRALAERMSGCIRAKDTLARVGGDEFLIVLPGIGSLAEIESIADRIVQACADAVRLDGRAIAASVSVGVGLARGRRAEPLRLRIDADRALYRAKRRRSAYAVAPEV